MIRAAAVAGLLLWLVAASAGAEPAIRWTVDERFVTAEQSGNRLVVPRRAEARFSTLEGLASGIEQSLPPQVSVIRLYRTDPPRLVEYVLGVSEQGRLLVGQQHRHLALPERTYVFDRGEIERAYSPIEQRTPWAWLLDIPLTREARVTLFVQADSNRWPVESLTIQVFQAP
jgi:hypothetical protein